MLAPDGWFRTGDLEVTLPDGYVQVVDRAEDVIISGGENIASIEVENVLTAHPARFKAPKAVHFWDLPKTSTGKIQKAVLRRRAAG